MYPTLASFGEIIAKNNEKHILYPTEMYDTIAGMYIRIDLPTMVYVSV